MLIYRRNIKRKLWTLRIMSVTCITAVIVLHKLQNVQLTYLFWVLILFAACLPVSGLEVEKDNIRFERYLLFAWIPFRYTFSMQVLQQASLIQEHEKEYLYTHGETWLDLFSLFFPLKTKRQGIGLQESIVRKNLVFPRLFLLSDKELQIVSSLKYKNAGVEAGF